MVGFLVLIFGSLVLCYEYVVFILLFFKSIEDLQTSSNNHEGDDCDSKKCTPMHCTKYDLLV